MKYTQPQNNTVSYKNGNSSRDKNWVQYALAGAGLLTNLIGGASAKKKQKEALLQQERNALGIWQLNEFRDVVKNPADRIIDNDGNLIESNIIDKQWYNKGYFFGNYVVVRMEWENKEKILKHRILNAK